MALVSAEVCTVSTFLVIVIVIIIISIIIIIIGCVTYRE